MYIHTYTQIYVKTYIRFIFNSSHGHKPILVLLAAITKFY